MSNVVTLGAKQNPNQKGFLFPRHPWAWTFAGVPNEAWKEVVLLLLFWDGFLFLGLF